MLYPGTEEVLLVSSLTSTNIQKATFVLQSFVWGSSGRGVDAGILDDPLCRLVDHRSGELEVDFRFADTGIMGADERAEESKFVKSLEKFREKGRMRVVCVGLDGSERVVYSSGGVICT
jgi:hypothetical protein